MAKRMMAFVVFMLGLCSCDDGNIVDNLRLDINEGYVVKMTGTLKNLDQWDDEKYQLVVAAFAAQDSYPLLAKKISAPSGHVDYVFEGIDPDCETIELCILNLINKRVATLATIHDRGESPNHSLGDTLFFNADNTDVGMYACIQGSIFDKRCIFCHGMGESPASGLYLTAGDSHGNLVGVDSKKVTGMKRVSPNNASESVLYKVLTEYDENSAWHYDHTKFFYGNTASNLVKEWIEQGARE